MGKYILLFVMAGQAPAQLGSYDDLLACHAAIRKIMTAQLAPGTEDVPAVREAIDVALKYQREYHCVSASSTKSPDEGRSGDRQQR